MGTRYLLTLDCPNCGKTNDDVYYAPTCDMTDWRCEFCDKVFDIEQFFKVSYEEASSVGEIQKIIDSMEEDRLCLNPIP